MVRKFANDDANLNIGSIVTDRVRTYSDINMLFQANPSSGDIFISRDAAAVKQAVKNLILTNSFDKPFRPDVGGNIRSFLFDNWSPFSQARMEDLIREAIQNDEPRAQVLQVIAQEDGPHNIVVTVEFLIRETRERITLQVVLQRLR